MIQPDPLLPDVFFVELISTIKIRMFAEKTRAQNIVTEWLTFSQFLKFQKIWIFRLSFYFLKIFLVILASWKYISMQV